MVLPNKKNPTTDGDALVDYFIYENKKKKKKKWLVAAVGRSPAAKKAHLSFR